jgi:hypothetical protein
MLICAERERSCIDYYLIEAIHTQALSILARCWLTEAAAIWPRYQLELRPAATQTR